MARTSVNKNVVKPVNYLNKDFDVHLNKDSCFRLF